MSVSAVLVICAVIAVILLASIYLALGEVVDELSDMNALTRDALQDEYKRGLIEKPRRKP